MKKAMATVLMGAMVALAACGPGTESGSAGAAPVTDTTVPSDPTSYAAQEWATFRLVELPTTFKELDRSFISAYNSTAALYSPSSVKEYRAEVSPVLHRFDVLVDSLRPAVGVLDAAGRAGKRDNDLADLAPELVQFHNALVEYVGYLHDLHNATLAFDSDRWDVASANLRAEPLPVTFVCAYYSIASGNRWSGRFTPAMNDSIARGIDLYDCDGSDQDVLEQTA